MDRTAIEELSRFADYGWRRYEEHLRPLGDEVLNRPAPGSGWPALRDALAHMNWAYVRWLADPNATTDPPVGSVETWEELDALRTRVRDHFRASVDALDDRELAVVRDMNVDGETLRYSRADIFVHVLIHERQHHGDLNTLLYQLGIEVPLVEYRFSLPDRGA
ncbi:MAG TPA: DinB family protein [Actinomycetota bacterium]|nr:DinB family protein [Actinomycetota bacterium]